MNPTDRVKNIRLAVRKDFPIFKEWDEFWGDRRQEMQRGEIYVAVDSADVCVGYIRVARNEFLNYPLIAALCVRPDCRREWIAIRLIRHAESALAGLRVFCTTEETNKEMLSLLAKAGYTLTGHIDALNSDGARELIFVKDLMEALI